MILVALKITISRRRQWEKIWFYLDLAVSVRLDSPLRRYANDCVSILKLTRSLICNETLQQAC